MRMKCLSAMFLSFLSVLVLPACLLAETADAVRKMGSSHPEKIIYVDGNLNLADGDGSSAKPFGTIEEAQACIRRLGKTVSSDISVVLAGTFRYGETSLHGKVTSRKRDIMSGDGKNVIGSYEISTALKFDEKDCLADGHKITFRSLEGKAAVISGGARISGWSLHDAKKNIWKANVGPINSAKFARQLYVNGKRATRARSDGRPAGTLFKDNQIYFSDPSFSAPSSRVPGDMQAMYFREWCSYMIGVKEISYDRNARRYRIEHEEDAWDYVTRVTSKQTNVNSAGCLQYLENAYVLLDAPSEFFIDRRTGDVYYIPMDDEDMAKAEVQVPVVDELVNVAGSKAGTPVCNIEFNGIIFECSTWLRPNGIMGHIANQADTIRHEGSRLGEGAFNVANARNIDISWCKFRNIGNIAIFYRANIQDCDVTGCSVTQVAGNGIVMGEPAAVGKVDANEPSEQSLASRNCSISNNCVAGAGIEHPSAAGIVSGFLVNGTITSNEIVDSAYSGISVGWHRGGEKTVRNNIISNNRILNTMTSGLGDGGGIYHLGPTAGSAASPGYLIKENYVFNQMNTYGVLYADNSSSWLVFDSNVVDTRFSDTEKVWSAFTQGNNNPATNIIFSNNFFTGGFILDCGYKGRRITADDRTGGNKFVNNTFNPVLPAPALEIMARSGLTAKYKGISNYKESMTADPGFEFTTSGAAVIWQAKGAALYRTTSRKCSGTYGGMIILENPEGLVSQKLKLDNSKKYNVSLYVIGSAGEQGSAVVSLVSGGKETEIASAVMSAKSFSKIGGFIREGSAPGADTVIYLKFKGLKKDSMVVVDDFYVAP